MSRWGAEDAVPGLQLYSTFFPGIFFHDYISHHVPVVRGVNFLLLRVFGRSESFYRQSNVVYASDIESLNFWKFSVFLTVVFSLATRHGLAGALFFSDLQRFRWRDRRLSVFPIARRFHRAMH